MWVSTGKAGVLNDEIIITDAVLCPTPGSDSKEFIQLILAQPLNRSSIFIGHFLGMNLSLISAFVIGTGLPFLLNGVIFSDYADSFVLLLMIGVFLICMFLAISSFIILKI